VPDYTNYTLDDFLQDPAFWQWVLHGTPADNAHWAALMEQYPHQRTCIGQAREMLLAVHEQVETDFPTEGQVAAMFGRIQSEVSTAQVRPLWRRMAWRVAASVLLVLGLGTWWWLGTDVPGALPTLPFAFTKQPTLEEVINNTATALPVRLPDGSHAWLQPRSQLSYRRAFADTIREVFLTGEAFFEVRKNPAKPFLVRANDITTRVLGTSFWVKAYEQEQQVTVVVKTGRVSVFQTQNSRQPDPETAGLVLTPNQQAVFGKTDSHFTRSLVARPTPVLTDAELQQFAFSNAPLPGILAAIEKAYGVEILYDETLLQDCRLTTSLGNETLFEKLDILCEATGATYKLVDAQILIDSKGCN
jgi:transmembrane sensor